MAVNQSAQSIFGLAKFEGDNPWNAALAGSLSANAVSFSLAAMEGEVLAAIYISATLEGDTMNGFFIRSDSNGKASRGDFTATMISPDTSSYTPAVVTTAPLPAVQTEQVSTEQKNEATSQRRKSRPLFRGEREQIQGCYKAGKGNQSQHIAQDGSTVGVISEGKILLKAFLAWPGT